MIKAVQRPGIGLAAKIMREAIARREFLVIIGECSVDYQGRSESRLTRGERLIIIKQDGALLIHRPTGYSPANWQPSTSVIELREDGDKLVVLAVRSKPREYLWINFFRIDLIVHGRLTDKGSFVMYMDEHQIRDLLFEYPELVENGMKFLEKEKKIGDGYADLYGVDSEGRPVIVEIKRVNAGREAVLQLYSYVNEYYKQTGVKPRGILVAPTLSSSAIESARKLGLEWREVNLQKMWKLKKKNEYKHSSLLNYIDGE